MLLWRRSSARARIRCTAEGGSSSPALGRRRRAGRRWAGGRSCPRGGVCRWDAALGLLLLLVSRRRALAVGHRPALPAPAASSPPAGPFAGSGTELPLRGEAVPTSSGFGGVGPGGPWPAWARPAWNRFTLYWRGRKPFPRFGPD